jgi:hypothetical protein
MKRCEVESIIKMSTKRISRTSTKPKDLAYDLKLRFRLTLRLLQAHKSLQNVTSCGMYTASNGLTSCTQLATSVPSLV